MCVGGGGGVSVEEDVSTAGAFAITFPHGAVSRVVKPKMSRLISVQLGLAISALQLPAIHLHSFIQRQQRRVCTHTLVFLWLPHHRQLRTDTCG